MTFLTYLLMLSSNCIWARQIDSNNTHKKIQLQVRTNSTYVPFQMLPFTTVSANYHSFSLYFQVQEWICMEMYLQPIDRGWTFPNNRLISLKIDLPLANCSDLWYTKLKLLNGDIYWFPNGNVYAIPPPHPKTLIIKDVPASKECWGMGCDIPV